MKDEKICLSVAARALRVSERTLIRYAEKGLISKVKENNRIYFLADEIRQFRQENVKPRHEYSEKNDNDFTVTIPYAKLQSLLSEIGELKSKNSFLLEYKINNEKLSKELDHTKGILEENDGFLKNIFEENKEIRAANESQHDEIKELKKNLQSFQKEFNRLKSRGLIKRIFNK